jgi:hypothetical protein
MNNMEWEKKGLLFSVENGSGWMHSYAALPFAEHLRNDMFRIYFTTRDKKNRSHGAFIDIDLKKPTEVLNISQKPLVRPGPLGSFDDSGAMPSCIVNFSQKKNLYYTGWALGITVPFYFYIGLATASKSERKFHRIRNVPLLDRNDIDPYLTASPSIIVEKNIWKMWYVSCEKWILDRDRPRHFYTIKYAESLDGIEWTRTGITCIKFKNSEEYAISRPCVIRNNDTYMMFYSYRGGNATYRIGYAESENGINWTRKDDETGIDVSRHGWDAEMIEYPYVFCHKNKTYLLYNGNGYGKSGFGYAILKNQRGI